LKDALTRHPDELKDIVGAMSARYSNGVQWLRAHRRQSANSRDAESVTRDEFIEAIASLAIPYDRSRSWRVSPSQLFDSFLVGRATTVLLSDVDEVLK